MGSLINISWFEQEWLCNLIMPRLAFSFDGKILPIRVLFRILVWDKGGKERAQYFPPLGLQYSLLCMCHLEPFCLFLNCPVSSAIPPHCAPTLQQWQASSCFWNALPFHASGPLHMLSYLLAVPFPLPFLPSLPDRWTILLSESFLKPRVELVSGHATSSQDFAEPPPRKGTRVHPACVSGPY